MNFMVIQSAFLISALVTGFACNSEETTTDKGAKISNREYHLADTLMDPVSGEDTARGKALELAGMEYIEKGETDKAFEIFEELMRVEPGSAGIVEDIGDNFLVEQQWEDAVRFLQLAVNGHVLAGTEHSTLYYNKGFCHLRLERYLPAAESFRKSLDIDPDNREVHYSLFLTYYRGELWSEAVMEGLFYTAKYPNDHRGWQVLSLSYSGKGMQAEAGEAERKYKKLWGE